jgi:hypothetical protein
VADVNVTMDAAHGVLGGGRSRHDGMNEVPVTNEAVLLQDFGIRLLDHDGLVKVFEGEALGMVPAVFGFGDQLGNERVR